MPAVDDVIRAFAEREQLLADIRKDLAGLVVGRVLRQGAQIVDQLEDGGDDLLVMGEALAEPAGLANGSKLAKRWTGVPAGIGPISRPF